jgi:DNA-binding GntR family transcriptional regulator
MKPRQQNPVPSGRGLPRLIAGKIQEWVRRESAQPGTRLAEKGLAEFFGVSRTPVRQAIDLLAAKGIVERIPHRGVYLRRRPGPQRKGAEHPTVEDALYLRVADDYLNGTLEAHVVERNLMQRYGISRVKLMRIFSRMVREGWLEKSPGHGWNFLPVLRSPQTYAQSYRFRAIIEPAALLEPGYRLDQAVIDRLRSEQRLLLDGGWRTFSRAETHRIGSEFHETIVAGSNNPFYVESLRRVNAMRRLLEYRIHRNRDWLVKVCREHLQLLELIESGDLAAAADFLRVHLHGSRATKTRLATSSL